jgi:two-component system response regulator QseB
MTARDGLDDRLRGLDGGADDYLVKPFALAELVSRLRALSRRSSGPGSETFELRGLRVHDSTQCVIVDGHTVGLSRSEYRLLTALLKRPDRVLTRRKLEEQLLPAGLANESNVLDVHISNLRRKIGQGYIRTVRGIGYVIDSLPSREAGHHKTHP